MSYVASSKIAKAEESVEMSEKGWGWGGAFEKSRKKRKRSVYC